MLEWTCETDRMLCPAALAIALAAAPGAERLSGMDAGALLACAGDPARCDASDWDLARELARREDAAALLARHARTSGPARRVVFFALYLAEPTPTVDALMRRLSRSADEEVAYYALNHRAKRCDPDALQVLSAPPYWIRAACEQWATTVALFGACRFEPGVPFLVWSLRHACLNVVDAAMESLRVLHPEAPAFSSPAEAERWLRRRPAGR